MVRPEHPGEVVTTAWAPAVTRLVAEVIVLDARPTIRVKTRSGHLIGYCKDIAEVERRVTNLGYTMADIEIKEHTS